LALAFLSGISVGETPVHHSLLFRLSEVDPECNAQPSLPPTRQGSAEEFRNTVFYD